MASLLPHHISFACHFCFGILVLLWLCVSLVGIHGVFYCLCLCVCVRCEHYNVLCPAEKIDLQKKCKIFTTRWKKRKTTLNCSISLQTIECFIPFDLHLCALKKFILLCTIRVTRTITFWQKNDKFWCPFGLSNPHNFAPIDRTWYRIFFWFG